jgi:AraC-like DNA-binding protein
MLDFISYQGNSLKHLHEKIATLQVNDASAAGFAIMSEYLQIDQEIECIWLKITTNADFFLSKTKDDILFKGTLIGFVYTNPASNFELKGQITHQIKQGVVLIPHASASQFSFSNVHEGQCILLNLPEGWCKGHNLSLLETNKLFFKWQPIYGHYFKELQKSSSAIARKAILSQFVFQNLIELAQSSEQRNNDAGLDRVKNYLVTHLHQPFPSLVFLAELSNMSVSQLKNKFRQLEASSPQQFFIERRLETAKNFLEKGISVKETAMSVGYTNSSNFVNAFKKKYGFPPTLLMKVTYPANNQ